MESNSFSLSIAPCQGKEVLIPAADAFDLVHITFLSLLASLFSFTFDSRNSFPGSNVEHSQWQPPTSRHSIMTYIKT